MEFTNGSEIIFPKFRELDERCLPRNDFLTSDKALELNQDIIFDSDSFADIFDFPLQRTDFFDEFLAQNAGITADGRNLFGEGIQLHLESVDLGLKFHILFGNFVLLLLDFSGQSLLRKSDFRNGIIQFGDGFLHGAFSNFQSFEVGDSGGDLDGPLVDHHFKRKLEGIDFFDPDIKFGTPLIEVFGHIAVEFELFDFRESGDEVVEGFDGLFESESSFLGSGAESPREGLMDLFDSLGLKLDLTNNKLLEISEIDLGRVLLSEGLHNHTPVIRLEISAQSFKGFNGSAVVLKGFLVLEKLEDAHHERLNLFETLRIFLSEKFGVLDDCGEDFVSVFLEMLEIVVFFLDFS